MYTIVDYTFVMPDKQEEINEYVKESYSSVYPWRGKSYVSIENDEYEGADDVIDDVHRVQEAFPGKNFEVWGSVHFSSGEFFDYKYVIKDGKVKYMETTPYSIIDDFSDYSSPDELLDEYPELGASFDSETLQQWIDKGVDEIYYWGNTISENPPEEYGESIDCK